MGQRLKRCLTLFLLPALALAACKQSSYSPSSSASQAPLGQAIRASIAPCHPEGASLRVAAEGNAFDKDCLAAPAGQPFTIAFENRDSADHNIWILRSHDSPDVLFQGATFSGPATMTYQVGALPAGTYHFHCSLHMDTMNGSFVAG